MVQTDATTTAPLPRPLPAAPLAGPSYDLLPLKTPSFRYLLLSGPGTGAAYLCRRLANVDNRLGLPLEYLDPNIMRAIVPRIVPGASDDLRKVRLAEYMRGVERIRTTADGAFGIHVQLRQIRSILAGPEKHIADFCDRFDRVILVRRGDKLGQAVSNALALPSGDDGNEGREPRLDAAAIDALLPRVAENLARYVDEEAFLRRLAAGMTRPFLWLTYEEIQADGDACFRRLLDFLLPAGVGDVREAAATPPVERVPGALHRDVRARFLAFIAGQGEA